MLAAAISFSKKAALAKTSQLALSMSFNTFTSIFLGSTTSPIVAAQGSTANTFMEVAKLILEYLKVLAWPLIVISLIYSYRSQIGKLLTNFSEADSLTVEVLGQPLKMNKTKTSETLNEIISEMKTIVKEITPEDRKKLEEIMNASSCIYSVKDKFPDFDRKEGNKSHETLRKFREAQFIRPQGGGQWEEKKKIEIKPFGRLMWDQVGPKKLF